MRTESWVAVLLAPCCIAGIGLGQVPPATEGHTARLAAQVLLPQRPEALKVTSPAIKDGGDIPLENTQYGSNLFPGLDWNAGPVGTVCYVIIVQGAGGNGGPTSIQFTLLNVPATVTSLERNLSTPPAGSRYGPNVHGQNQPYAGPHTHTAERHAYHFQVFALDMHLQAPPDEDFDTLLAAMNGHVLAIGDLVAYMAKPEGAQ